MLATLLHFNIIYSYAADFAEIAKCVHHALISDPFMKKTKYDDDNIVGGDSDNEEEEKDNDGKGYPPPDRDTLVNKHERSDCPVFTIFNWVILVD